MIRFARVLLKDHASVLLISLFVFGDVYSMPFVTQFTVAGFSGSLPAPTDPVTGRIIWEGASANSPISSLYAIQMSIDGHAYSTDEISYVNSPYFGLTTIGGNLNGRQSVSSGTNDFWITWNRDNLQPSPYYGPFIYASANHGGAVWTAPSASNFSDFSIASINFDDVIRDSVTFNLTNVHNGNPKTFELVFRPNFGLTLDEAAAIGGYDHFNWLSVIRQAPLGGPYPKADGLGNKFGTPYAGWDLSPYYYEEQPGSGHNPEFIIGHPRNTPNNYALRFEDTPGCNPLACPSWDGTPPFLFNTFLIGVEGPVQWDLLSGWEWASDNRGLVGGVMPPDQIFELGNLDPIYLDEGGIVTAREITIADLSSDVRTLLIGLGAQNLPQSVPEPNTLALFTLTSPYFVVSWHIRSRGLRRRPKDATHQRLRQPHK